MLVPSGQRSELFLVAYMACLEQWRSSGLSAAGGEPRVKNLRPLQYGCRYEHLSTA
jgi:hypothetical protein